MKKYLIIAIFAICISSCHAQPKMAECDHTFCKSFLEAKDSQVVFYKRQYEFIERQNDTLRTKLFLANYRVEKVRYYLNICLRNKSQDKFLKGWVRRAIE